MRIWLDDERDPKEFGRSEYLWIKTAEELIQYLDTHGMAHILDLSLDHDLGIGRMTGYDAICWIETQVANGATPPRSINLHTQNPVGRAKMHASRAKIYKMITHNR